MSGTTTRRTFLAGSLAVGAATLGEGAGDAGNELRPHLNGAAFQGMEGVYAALFTPFDRAGRLNEEMVEREVEHGLRNGLRGFYLTGGTGEGLVLSHDERVRVYRRAVKASAGRAKLIAHVGCTATDDAVRLARAAADAGVDWISSVPPVCYGMKFEDVCRHYRLIASATDRPFLIYAVNGSKIDPDRDARLFDAPNVMGMKYTGTDFYDVQRLKRRLAKETLFFSGSDQHFVAALAFGNVFSGSIGTVQNIVPGLFVAIYRAMMEGDVRSAARLQEKANRIVEFVCHAHPNASFRKGMMRYIGLDCGSFRAPQARLSEEEYEALTREADAWGLVPRNAAIR